MVETTLSMASASVTLRTIPRPLMFASLRKSVIVAAPLSEVAVPITVAPCSPKLSAIALPIPRVAPVTRAIFPSKLILFS